MGSGEKMKRLDQNTEPAQYPSAIRPMQSQAGGILLAVVTVLGVVMILVQGSVFYRAKGSANFVGSEKGKILAQQMAEAGVEDNIADLGSRKFKVTGSLNNYTTYDHKSLGDGSYTSQITTVGMGSAADTVDLRSTGVVGKGTQTVLTRLRLRKFMDTTLTTASVDTTEMVTTIGSHAVPETTTTAPMNPAAMPAVNTTAAYTSCMASALPKCDVCHLPGGVVAAATVLNIAKGLIITHKTHVGDYVTTDGTCDLYKAKQTITFTMVPDTTTALVHHTVLDTTLAIDTAVKVQFLSWK